MTDIANRRVTTPAGKPARRSAVTGADAPKRREPPAKAARKGVHGVALYTFREKWRDAPLKDRVQIERDGVPAGVVKVLIDKIGVSSVDFISYVGIPKATFSKKMRERSAFAGTPGQSVVGFVELINKVEDILAAQRDNPEATNFDVEKWVGEWVERPQPALGGMTPAELMDTPSGRASVMRVLGAMQSGAYQ
ncbi:antitoxin Xre/MbcA/ParS toxin-binding domain-containing protein [Luteimonas sp. MHLX1A]|uniref:antitoxin Xre/MbcA/ParS toxin-binding domain-containing protein n=1 Tax=Alterluteimonas muca TaxID=2878684 RepID=UPI001E573F24|nr:antitoxin Xre/MbcA/ParS toxin-binding domain-containing protein [Luteimonas sp. MHLX1A]MCD9046813.1 MbcA/ParS/Xre antitoxin family protein [Luteimonas sp. MHLX1A]